MCSACFATEYMLAERVWRKEQFPHSVPAPHCDRSGGTPRAPALLHGSYQILQCEEQWEDGDRVELGCEVDRARAINKKHDVCRLARETALGLEHGICLSEWPCVENQQFRWRLWGWIPSKPA
jgi:hypothetical protein